MSPVFRLNLMLTAAMNVAVLIAAPLLGFAFPQAGDLVPVAVWTGLFLAIALIYTFIRFDADISRSMYNIALCAFFMSTGIMMSYLMTSANRPLVDADLAAIDAALGFDWPKLVAFVADHPWIGRVSGVLYNVSLPLFLFILLFLGFKKRNDRIEEFVLLLILTGIVSNAVAALLPAEGTYLFHKPSQALISSLTPTVDPAYMSDFHGLRDGTIRQLAIAGAKGLVTFPSYHTIFSLLMVYALRGMGPVFYAALAINLGIIASTPLDGAHYLTDVIGGVAIFALLAVFASRLQRYLTARFEPTVWRPVVKEPG